MTTIDHRQGWLTMRTDHDTQLRMQFPPDTLRAVRVGDPVTARMSFHRAESQQGAQHAADLPKAPAEGGLRAGDNPPPGGALIGENLISEHHVSGVITNVDRNTGVVAITTGTGDMQLQFPPEAVRNLNGGARIDVALGLSRGELSHREER